MDAALDVLAQANSQEENGHYQTRLLLIRHRKFVETAQPAPRQPWPQPVADLFPGVTGIPEVHAGELTVELATSAIRHHGSLVVRQWLRPEACAFMRDSIDQSFAAAEEVAGQDDFESTPWYRHFTPVRGKGFRLNRLARDFVNAGAGILAVDSPRALCRFLDCLFDSGVDKFLAEYFGEPPAFSAKKTTLRRTPPDSATGWHQDGSYFSGDVRALNIWTALSPCGVDAPSLDIVAERIDAPFVRGGVQADEIALTEENAAEYGGHNVVRPVLEPGDAVLFDEMALHRTGVSPAMTKTRYAVEMWFFAPSMFPIDEVPLYL